MKLRHFAVFGGIFTVIICLLLFLFIWTEPISGSIETSVYGRKVCKGIQNL